MIVLVAPAMAGELEHHITLDSSELLLTNLIGEIRIEQASGERFEIDISIQGDDAQVGLIEIEQEEGRRGRVAILFPLDEERTYVYPHLGRHVNMSFTPPRLERKKSGWSGIFGRGDRNVRVKGRGRGLELWVDVTVKVPAGKQVAVRHGAGEILAENLVADVDLDISCGPIRALDIKGPVRIDTGSGSVEAFGLIGDIEIDTGSGSVDIARCRGGEIMVDTGSGEVRAARLECTDLEIDTGSGSVSLQLDRMSDGRYLIDTGSGSIELELPEDASASIRADTGSGSIRANIDGRRIRKKDHARFRIGDGAARIDLDTGSGSIHIRG